MDGQKRVTPWHWLVPLDRVTPPTDMPKPCKVDENPSLITTVLDVYAADNQKVGFTLV